MPLPFIFLLISRLRPLKTSKHNRTLNGAILFIECTRTVGEILIVLIIHCESHLFHAINPDINVEKRSREADSSGGVINPADKLRTIMKSAIQICTVRAAEYSSINQILLIASRRLQLTVALILDIIIFSTFTKISKLISSFVMNPRALHRVI